jgi:hypothetical protein
MKRKLLTETPMYPREHLVIISTQPACPLLKKGLGHLLQLLLLSFIYSHFIYLHYQIPLKTYLLVFTVKPWLKPLINTFCSSLDSTLLFIESTTIHPLYLWVISAHQLSHTMEECLFSFFLELDYNGLTSSHAKLITSRWSCLAEGYLI